MGYTGERSSQGEAHGQGTQTWPNGDRYEGTWQEGKRHGKGRARERQPRIRRPA